MYKTRVLLFAAVFLMLIATLATAQYPIISGNDVRTRMTGKKKAVVVDTRSPEEYREGHISGAISIPAEQMKNNAALLPKDITAPIIFYCRGAG